MFLLSLSTFLAAILHKDVEAGMMGMGGMGMGGMGMGGMGMGGMGMGGMGMGSMGGFAMDQSMFNSGKKNMNDMFYNGKGGQEGGQFGTGQQGFMAGEDMKTLKKGEEGAFQGHKGGKKMMENGMGYQGQNKFGKGGKKGDQKKMKEGHKKGHGVKSYKTSHEKNENSQTEEFYDEVHDEGAKAGYAGQMGAFGEKKGSGTKGEQGEGMYKAAEGKKSGKFGEKYLQDTEKGMVGKYGDKKYAGQQGGYALNNEGDLKKVDGHEEAQNMFKYHKHPMMMGR